MTVVQLIAELQKWDPDLTVTVHWPSAEMPLSVVSDGVEAIWVPAADLVDKPNDLDWRPIPSGGLVRALRIT